MAARSPAPMLAPRERSTPTTDEAVVDALRDAHGAINDLMRQSVATFRLIPTEYRALGRCARWGEITPKNLAEGLGITPASTTELLDRLERRRLLTRRTNPEDRRSMLIRLTPQGRSTFQSARTVYRRSVARVSRGMSREGQSSLVQGVAEFLLAFRASAASPSPSPGGMPPTGTGRAKAPNRPRSPPVRRGEIRRRTAPATHDPDRRTTKTGSSGSSEGGRGPRG